MDKQQIIITTQPATTADNLSYSGRVTPYGDRKMSRHWLKQEVAWRHRAITWTNVDFI